MEPWIQMVVTIVCSVIASSGFWAFVNKRSDSRDVKTEMLVGLAHDRIVYLGMMYIPPPLNFVVLYYAAVSGRKEGPSLWPISTSTK